MASIILLIYSSECEECSNSPNYYLNLDEIKMFNTEQGLYEYFYNELQIEHLIDVDFEKTEKYNKFIEERRSFVSSRPDSSCRDCGTIYIYGEYDKLNNINFTSPCNGFVNINDVITDVSSDESSIHE